MDLFIVVIAILFVQIWGAENPLHRDHWFELWGGYLFSRIKGFDSAISLQFFLAVGGPLLAIVMLMWLLGANSNWLHLPISVVILLYSFGRGEFSELLDAYTSACAVDNWELAFSSAQKTGIDVSNVSTEDWRSLHYLMLEGAAYRGFERMFAVLFWFFLIGPLGALAYRLVFLYHLQHGAQNPLVKKTLWLIEWPAARVLGLSFALTGNFAACVVRWRDSVFCLIRPTQMMVAQAVFGALSMDDPATEQVDMSRNCDVTRRELNLLDGLYRRTLWLWLAGIAISVIVV